MTAINNIEKKALSQTLALCPELKELDSILLAISGGLDSMTLLEIFYRLAEQNRWRLIVGHLNHCLRGQDSDRDEEYVRAQCHKRDIPFFCKQIDIKAMTIAERVSVEAAARIARYNFLTGVCRENNCHYLATAHHADDNAETVLHRIIRGTGIRGLAGIQPSRRILAEGYEISLFRPLLGITRKELEDYCQHSNLKFCHDSSNDTMEYTRNQIRNSLLPMLREQFNPGLDKSLNNLSRIASDSDSILCELAENDLRNTKATLAPGLLQIELKELKCLTPGRCRNMFRNALEMIGMPMADIGFQNIEYLQKACSDNRSRKLDQLPGNFRAEINNNCLIIARIRKNFDSQINLNIPGIIAFEGLFTIDSMNELGGLTAEIVDLSSFDLKHFIKTKNNYQEIIDPDKITGKLYLAPLRSGQKYQPLGLTGSQTTGDIMTNKKIPRYLRNSIAAINDCKGIVAIAGLRIADRVKIDTSSKKGLLLRFNLQSNMQ